MYEKQLKCCFFIDLNVKWCYFIIIQKKKPIIRSVIVMIEEEIKKTREKLNKSIEENEKYEILYNLSIKLDKLIIEYYKKQI